MKRFSVPVTDDNWRCCCKFAQRGQVMIFLALYLAGNFSACSAQSAVADPFVFVATSLLEGEGLDPDFPPITSISVHDHLGPITIMLGWTPHGNAFRYITWLDLANGLVMARLEEESTGWWVELESDYGVQAQSWQEWADVVRERDGKAGKDWRLRARQGDLVEGYFSDDLQGYRGLAAQFQGTAGFEPFLQSAPEEARQLIRFLDSCIAPSPYTPRGGQEGDRLAGTWRPLVEILAAISKQDRAKTEEISKEQTCAISKLEQDAYPFHGPEDLQPLVDAWGPRLTDSAPMRAFLERHPVEPEEKR